MIAYLRLVFLGRGRVNNYLRGWIPPALGLVAGPPVFEFQAGSARTYWYFACTARFASAL